MPFVKLDCGLLDSTLWLDTIARDVFITALLMAEPMEVKDPMAQINVRDLNGSGFFVPPGWYGFVAAAGTGIIHRAGVPLEQGLKALEILGSEDPESRTPAFGGRRMVRVDGGYLILNFIKYREKDATSAERSKRWRERQKLKAVKEPTRVTDTPTPVIRHQAEAEAEAINKDMVTSKGRVVYPEDFLRFWTCYPKKVAKGEALKAWKKISPTDDLLEAILRSIDSQKQTEEWFKEGGKYIPHPAKWLNATRWEDEAVSLIKPSQVYSSAQKRQLELESLGGASI